MSVSWISDGSLSSSSMSKCLDVSVSRLWPGGTNRGRVTTRGGSSFTFCKDKNEACLFFSFVRVKQAFEGSHHARRRERRVGAKDGGQVVFHTRMEHSWLTHSTILFGYAEDSWTGQSARRNDLWLYTIRVVYFGVLYIVQQVSQHITKVNL